MNPPDLSQSPVLALENNILWQFENVSPHGAEQLKLQVARGALAGEMVLNLAATCPKPPFVETDGAAAPVVHLHVAFLELLWAFIYSWMVLYEEGVQKPQLDAFVGADGQSQELMDRAHELLGWATTLRERYAFWPTGLPSPKCYASEVEQYYGEKANLVFQKATAFLLSHERAHAVLGHLETLRHAGSDLAVELDLEKEADIAAFEHLVGQALDDNEKSAEAWAVLSVMLSTFYAYREPRRALVGGGHPALHHRLAHVVDSLAFESPKYQYYFQFLCRLVLQMVFPDVLTPTRQFEDWEEAFQDALDKLDDVVSGSTLAAR